LKPKSSVYKNSVLNRHNQGGIMKVILALDQGTTSSRAIVFDRQGTIRAIAQKEFQQIFPKPGWVEHDPSEIWVSQVSVAAEAMTRANISAKNIAAIGITNQRETTLVWNRKTGEPIGNAIVWQDRRTAPICDRLKSEGLEPIFRKKTGLLLDSYFSGTKLHWILKENPDAKKLAEQGKLAFGTIDSWLLYKMTNGKSHITDVTNASRTLLYNIHRQEWDQELLEILGIPESLLPEVRSSSEVYAETSSDLLSGAVPIAGIAGDQQAALFGQQCTSPGLAKNTYGTGCFLLLNTGEEAILSQNNLVTTIAWQIGDKTEYALEGSIFIAGAVIQWLRDGLGLIRSASDVEALARSVKDNGGVYLVPAFAGLGAPHWDPYARGIIAGLTRGSTAAHIARAALESIAYQVQDVLIAMQTDANTTLTQLRVDGGAAVNDLLIQFQSDLLQNPVVRPKTLETTALGAAYLAGLATGFWKDQDDIKSQWQVDQEFTPHVSPEQVQTWRKGWERALQRAQKWQEEGED
jgi:glycerol kinase